MLPDCEVLQVLLTNAVENRRSGTFEPPGHPPGGRTTKAPVKVLHIPADVAAPRFQRASCQQAGEGQAEKTGLLTWRTDDFILSRNHSMSQRRQPRPAGKLPCAGNILLNEDVNFYYYYSTCQRMWVC